MKPKRHALFDRRNEELTFLLGKALITTSFSRLVSRSYLQNQTAGTRESFLRWIVDYGNTDGLGIFDQNRVEWFERKAYRDVLLDYLGFERLYENISGEEEYKEHRDYLSRKGFSDPAKEKEELLKEWRKEFIERYADEP
ncbi:hypothetical protein HYU92_01440 [Candidatus Curtissbacteria bacterium]|nr:hypothetical protein [Candidatus Curtissbacteria bacterium]